MPFRRGCASPRLCSLFQPRLAPRGQRLRQLYHRSWAVREGALRKQLESRSAFVQALFRICLMLALLGTRVAASDPSLDVSQLAHTAWSARDGSFRGAIISIGQTSDGYLWLGTGFGLLRFDGVRFLEWRPRKGDSLPLTRLLAQTCDKASERRKRQKFKKIYEFSRGNRQRLSRVTGQPSPKYSIRDLWQ